MDNTITPSSPSSSARESRKSRLKAALQDLTATTEITNQIIEENNKAIKQTDEVVLRDLSRPTISSAKKKVRQNKISNKKTSSMRKSTGTKKKKITSTPTRRRLRPRQPVFTPTKTNNNNNNNTPTSSKRKSKSRRYNSNKSRISSSSAVTIFDLEEQQQREESLISSRTSSLAGLRSINDQLSTIIDASARADMNNNPNMIYAEYSPWQSKHKKYVFNKKNLNLLLSNNL